MQLTHHTAYCWQVHCGDRVADRQLGGGNTIHTKAASKLAHVQIWNHPRNLPEKVYHMTRFCHKAPAQPSCGPAVARRWHRCSVCRWPKFEAACPPCTSVTALLRKSKEFKMLFLRNGNIPCSLVYAHQLRTNTHVFSVLFVYNKCHRSTFTWLADGKS